MEQYCFNSSNEYLHYKCHFKLNNYFSGINIINDTENILINFLQQNITKRTYSQNEKQIINKLHHYLRGDGVFPWQDPTECCKYINYWLNTTVQKLVPGLYNTESFNIFQNIVKFYNEDKNNNKRCNSDIYYIDTLELTKMGVLYDLYKNYETLTAKYKGCNYSPCNILIHMYRNYNDALNLYGNNDNNLFSRLKEFKKLIDDILPQHKDCPSHIQFKDPESIKRKENIDSEHNTRTHNQTMFTPGLPRPKEESPLPEPGSPPPEKDLSPPETDLLPPETDSTSHPVLPRMTSELPEPHFRDTSSPSERNALKETNTGLSQTTYDGKLKGQTLNPGSDRSRELIYTHTLGNPFYSENEVLEKLGRKTSDDGFLGKVQGAFSTILENVEPAPILGVSGGMGALFLLFKYTPVGSYFGGRRGRMNRIPNNFGEYYTGFAPGFAEQDYGNFGNEGYHISYRPE
ncbi:unnamed protein product [Plasmodium vivax]|uniref:(malaria parasite P. vivax) hypothetical protein n=1 Tax=Plasmodium vivax TaxID=5855 RepID=A0A8S4H8W5_PLAVI|nr:unnamed protein product [Plasmodium vivax]